MNNARSAMDSRNDKTNVRPEKTRAGMLTVTTIGAAILVSACVGGGIGNNDTRSGLICVDDSQTCISRRQAALADLTSRTDKSWIRQRASPLNYASGVRLFALKSKKSTLNCEELKLGHSEASRAPSVMKAGPSAGLTPAQISRGKILASEVSRELKREMSRRCR